MIPRHLKSVAFSQNFGRQMRFIIGPRQAGKTTLAKEFLKEQGSAKLYYNWDQREIKSAYRQNPSFFMNDVWKTKQKGQKVWICLDEIHKIPKWKNHLKGIFDSYEQECQFIITGSAKLDLMKYTGESLLGRYFTFRLLPLTLSEVLQKKKTAKTPPIDALVFLKEILSQNFFKQNLFEQLLKQSGFPEPFLSRSAAYIKKWQNDYLDHYVKEDLQDLTNIHELENVFHLIELLPARIGSPLSFNALREDLEVSHTSVRNWIKALRLTYILFLVPPYSKKIKSSVKKETKAYFFDWTRAKEESAVFENYVCMELLNFCCFLTDAGLGHYDLFFVRTKDGKETDFLITQEKNPWLLIEAKLNEETIASHHKLHAKKLGDIPFVQLVKKPNLLKQEDKKYFVVSASRFFENLYLS